MKKLSILPIATIASLSVASLPLVVCSCGQTYDDTTPLCFNDAKGDGSNAKITYTIDGADLDIDIEYKLDEWDDSDGKPWTDWTRGKTITLEDGQKLFVRNNTNTLSRLNSHFKFIITGGKVIGSGNVNSMINYAPLTKACFINLFSDCKTLTRAPAVPAKTLAESCYQNMFSYCNALTIAPKLPAENLADYCYTAMFSGCTALKSAPRLNSKHLAPHCYEQMFDICGLTTAPKLPAENLADSCYAFMFCHCPIKNTPALPAKHLADNCYRYMFSNCRQLVKTTSVLPATQLKASCYDHMFAYCYELKTAPEIKGQITPTESEQGCYLKMFKDCKALKVEEDKPSGHLIYKFGDIVTEYMKLLAEQMFGFEDGTKRPWEGDGTPLANHAYYWVKG